MMLMLRASGRCIHRQKSEHTLDGPNGVGDGPTELDSPLDIVGADNESTERERG